MKNKKANFKSNTYNYFLAGLVAAAIIFVIITLTKKDEDLAMQDTVHIWSPETDSAFVKNCYEKYKPQIKDDLSKQELTKSFCRCMLEKVKSRYDEQDMYKVKDEELKKWDAECREQILNQNKIKIK